MRYGINTGMGHLPGVWILFDMYEIPIVIRLYGVLLSMVVGASGLCPIDGAEFRYYYTLQVGEIIY